MKKMYMLCNAHLDPVWLWKKEEGIAEAISTFRVAADFCEKYDGFIFNHNESLLYEWVEEYEPELFARIQKLVREGKWRIMGGWYLQPDCVMPSGESFIRQIEVGNEYFKEKFGIVPKTAINFDPFGHNQGLVQILKKHGYENYLFMRPFNIEPTQNFIWKGFDGSEILTHCTYLSYGTPRGKAIEHLENNLNNPSDVCLVLWGIGNHGGGPSEEDWQALGEYQKEHPELELIPCGCEEYFSTVEKDGLPVIDKSLVHCMIGCYTSMARIKQRHRQMENEVFLCEKMLAASGISYDEKEMKEAEKALLFSEFHDSLPGTMIRKAEESVLRQMDYGREIWSRYCMKAFYKLCEGQKKAVRGEIPVMVFNPNPYEVEQEVEVEFTMESQNHNDNEVTLARVRNEKGEYLPTQNIKEDSTLNLDWVKRIIFRATLAPMSINRFDCELYRVNEPKRRIEECEQTDTHFVFRNERMKVLINKETGLIDCYQVDGSDYLKEQSAQICVYDDNEDPWRMQVDGFYHKSGVFTLASKEEANTFNGNPTETLENVRVIENGDVITRIQATFKYNYSFAVVTYTFFKAEAYVDIHVKMYANDANKMFKLTFQTALSDTKFMGQMAFGTEELLKEEKEVFYQKWCGLLTEDKGFAVLNNGTYGGSCKENELRISMMRTPVYSAHPIGERKIADTDLHLEHIDMGEREFFYRLTTDTNQIDMLAEVYNQTPYVLSIFPSGAGEKADTSVELTNPQMLLTRYMKQEEGYLLRIYNASEEKQAGALKVAGCSYDIELRPFGYETYFLANGELKMVER